MKTHELVAKQTLERVVKEVKKLEDRVRLLTRRVQTLESELGEITRRKQR